MTTANDVARARADRAAWTFDPDQVRVDTEIPIDPKSSAARHADRVREGRVAAENDRAKVQDRLQAERKRQKAERARTKGLSTAEILAALGVPARQRAG